jgi:hypothetical protein
MVRILVKISVTGNRNFLGAGKISVTGNRNFFDNYHKSYHGTSGK